MLTRPVSCVSIGMAGHVQFGARTGGALIILGVVLLLTALLFSGSVATRLPGGRYWPNANAC